MHAIFFPFMFSYYCLCSGADSIIEMVVSVDKPRHKESCQYFNIQDLEVANSFCHFDVLSYISIILLLKQGRFYQC